MSTSTEEAARDVMAKAMCVVETRSKATSLEEVQEGIQRWTRHRWEAERLIEELSDAGYTLRALVESPTDEDRETRAGTAEDPHDSLSRVIWETSRADEGTISATGANIVARAVVAAGFRRVVSEPLTEEWEYGVNHVGVDGWDHVRSHETRESAEKDFATCGMNCSIIRRRTDRPAGPWEPVADDHAEIEDGPGLG